MSIPEVDRARIEGTDVNFTLATQTGVSKKDAKPSDPQPKMQLTPEEQEIYDGKKGELWQKAMKTVVAYGEMFGATKLVTLTGTCHMAMSWGNKSIEPNLGTSFQVQGVVADLPHLHKALDEAYKFRTSNSANYNYKFFDIDVEFTHAFGKYNMKNLSYHAAGGDDSLLPENIKPRKTLHYINCQVADYVVGTQHNSYRSYNVQAETGFAIVETIEFQCAGIRSEVASKDVLSYKISHDKINDFGKLDYKYADDIRTFVTFEFDNGIEKIEFPFFKLVSGFGEDDNPSFHVEGVVNRYPLLASAIDIARDTKGIQGGINTDFDVKVEFVQETSTGNETIFRGIIFEDCNIKGSGITTYYENEEIYVSTGGAGIMQTIDFDCGGMNPSNPRYDADMKTNEQYRDYNMASGPQAIAEFRFHDNTVEIIEFPTFRYDGILSKANVVFQLEGMVGDYPLLYKQVDDDAKINQQTGVSQAQELFEIDVNLMYEDNTIRGFSYTDCRVIDYIVETMHQNEEGFWRGLATVNTFEFECTGYIPNISDDGMILDTSIDDKTTTWAGHTFDGYLQAENVTSNFTFKFRDGAESHEFPVFKTTADFAENKGTSFQVQGVIADTPHLHKALDEAFKYRVAKNTGFDYNYKYFDVDAVINSDGSTRKIFYYVDCQIEDYIIDTLTHTHRGYLLESTGFAIVYTIDFDCAGIHSDVTNKSDLTYRTEPGVVVDFGKLGYDYADDIRTFVTFRFDNGMEKIEFPIFKTTSGFAEGDRGAGFHVEGIENRYPLLSSAVDNARDNLNVPVGTNLDFDVIAAFVQETPDGEIPLRGIYYEDCNVNGSDITTYWDKEEPYATVGGFAVNHSFDFDCIEMIPLNPLYDKSMKTNEQYHNYLMADGIHAISEFRFHDNTVEIIDFPIFKQHNVLSKSFPTFQLEGMVGNYPLLYKQVDKAARFNEVSGITPVDELFDVDVNLKDGDEILRAFSYSGCRVIDYAVESQQGNEEAFFFWFALESTFEFECLGYHPKNPVYDALFETDKGNTISSLDLRDTETWGYKFKYTPKR